MEAEQNMVMFDLSNVARSSWSAPLESWHGATNGWRSINCIQVADL